MEVFHEGVRGAVVAEKLVRTLVDPRRERVFRTTLLARDRVEERLLSEPTEEALDVAVEALLRDGDARIDVARQRLRPIGEALVHPRDLRVVLVVLEEVLVLVRKDSLVQKRPGGRVQAWIRRRLGRRGPGPHVVSLGSRVCHFVLGEKLV